MRRGVAFLAALSAAWPPCAPTPATADYQFCNHARFPTWSAFAYGDKDKGWLTIGWFEVKRMSCDVLISGSLKGRVFYHTVEREEAGKNVTNLGWPGPPDGKDQTFCVGEDHAKPFVIYKKDIDSSCQSKSYVERSFRRHAGGAARKEFAENYDTFTTDLGWPGSPLSTAEEKEFGAKDYFWECDECPKMVIVPAGELMMGSPDNEPGRNTNEGPRHKVSFRQPFAVAESWVSRGEFAKFVETTGHNAGDKCNVWKDGKFTEESGRSFRSPGFAQDDGDPVVCVNLNDAKSYIAWLSKQTGKTYRLPSEAEWEYVIRAGTETPFWWGAAVSTAQANYNGNLIYAGGAKGEFRQRTISTGLKASPWNLYGAGNAVEWTEDCWNDSYHGAPSDGGAGTSGDCSLHVVRGGSWASDPSSLRSAARAGVETGTRRNDLGFRVARPLAR